MSDALVTLGKITTAYGVRGWVKVYSYTQPMDSILEYSPWLLSNGSEQKSVPVIRGRSHGQGMVAYLEGVDTRDAAMAVRGWEIKVPKSALPELPEGDYYWHELIGLRAVTLAGVDLGRVTDLMSAGGANDVLIVQGDAHSHDQEQRLIPYVVEHYVKAVDLAAGTISLDWQPEY